jgi:hypothetical protein
MMDASIPAISAVFFALLLAALVAALIVSPDFRNAVLGGPGEATVFNFLTVKGAAIVLLCALFSGGLLFALTQLPSASRGAAPKGPVIMRLNVHFDPDEVNPRNPKFSAKAFLKTAKGVEPIEVIPKLSEGALSVQVNVPDMETPFFVIFDTPKGVWKTDDHSIRETAATARKQDGG